MSKYRARTPTTIPLPQANRQDALRSEWSVEPKDAWHAGPSTEATKPSAHATASGATCTLLIVEDDPVTLQEFIRFLRLEGFTVVGVANGDEAVAVVRSRRPDAIVLDLRLPGMDGVECLRQMRQAERHPIPVAIVTGDYFLGESELAAIEALGACVWYKPV